jgi:AraC-like DNA-binding protein
MSSELRMPQRSAALIEQIRELLAQRAPYYPGLDSLAAQFCITPRTLKRRLACRGLRYQDLLDQLRSAHALRLLAQPGLPIEQIAEQVGYSSAANFHRAFRRWTGAAPGAFRGAMPQGKHLRPAAEIAPQLSAAPPA